MEPENPAKPSEDEATTMKPRVIAILEAAVAEFARGGFRATTLAAIANQLGARKSIIHYYFATKAALVEEVQRWRTQRMTERLPTGGGHGLRGLLDAMRRDEFAELRLQVWAEAPRDDALRESEARVRRELRDRIAKLLAGGAECDPEALDRTTRVVMAALDGLSTAELLEVGSTDGAFEVLVELVSEAARKLRSGDAAALKSAAA